MAALETAPPVLGARERIATRIAFFIGGFAISAWAPLIPFAKRKLALDDGQLGLMLLCLGVGSVLMMPLAGGLAARFGCRRMILVAGATICLCMPALMLAPSIPVLALVLAVFGASMGVLDVVMNVQAVIVERDSGRAMMSGFHGMYSVGGIAGAGGVAGALTLGASPLLAIGGMAIVAALLLAASRRGLLVEGGDGDHPAFVLPRGRVLLIGAVCFAMFLSEGAVLDWSAVFLTSMRNADPATAGFGYVAFAVTMTIGRLTGDRIVQALGAFRVVVCGALVAASGFALAIFVPSPLAGLAGFALVGAGAANVVPVMFSAAGRQRGMPTHLAVAAVTTMGYAGVLLGPAALGFIAKGTSLAAALGLLVVLLVAVSLVARVATRD
ncbi:Predicted arabinose efflux permease, MFS family [Pseudoxanthomonas sp. CF385]|uniref:MFS transporter n=1 Tax=Pseudoxanthomonas sp. CF385 TaxID=1881042 RepID=UPI0008810C2A|nr:MFS transporter [Pseudoxanthomonas sp. CF385]SDQ41500.1 Predicted arabinose efflux permease, MFS family [Pseudoxanthomonas sp. CF385]